MYNFSSLYEGRDFNAWRRDNRANGMWMRSMKRKRDDEKSPRFFMGMVPYRVRLPENP